MAAPPARLFANTAYGVSVWAWFVLECYAYHRPLRTVARALATMGIPTAPGTLADAQSRLLGVFEPLDEAIAERQRPASSVQGDETRWMIHVRGERAENPRCWLWLCLSEDAVRMHIDPTRSARAARVLFAKLGEKLPAILVCDRYCARVFSDAELALIRTLIAEHDPALNRAALSRVVCERLDWRKPDGGLKDMSARVALLRMHREGVIALPPARKRPGPRKPIAPSPETDPPSLFEPPTSLEAVRPLCIEPVASRAEGRLWNAFVARYHYLGHHPLPGAQIRYFVRAVNGEPLAVLGFAAAAWKTAPRDEFIGWSPAVRQRNLALVVNNARFLILPWIRIRNLASHLLAQLQRRLPHDWERRYALRPVLLETFCESARFLGTCYQSANWLCVGETQGRGKLDVHRQSALPVKSVWLKPLQKNWRTTLCR